MEKLDLTNFRTLVELPLNEFNQARYSIYVIDKEWNYIFVNDFVRLSLGARAEGLQGKNLWESFPELAQDADFRLLRSNTEKGLDSNLVTVSPITGHRLNITGHALEDCFIFTSSILPRKEEVLTTLRQQLRDRQKNR